MKHFVIAAVLAATPLAPALGEEVNGLRTVDEFDAISDETERSRALFNEMMKVISSPRCLNCHPVDGGPRQGDDMQPHDPPVVRGAADFGAPGMRCSTCHGPENFDYASGEGSIPGHEPWHLAPVEMGCRRFQGYYFSRPETLDRLKANPALAIGH